MNESVIGQLFAAFRGISLEPFEQHGLALAISTAEELRLRGVKARPFFSLQIAEPWGRPTARLTADGWLVQVQADPGCSWDHIPGALVDGLLCRAGEPPEVPK